MRNRLTSSFSLKSLRVECAIGDLTPVLLKGTFANCGQPRTNTYHHPEKLLRDDDEDEGKGDDAS
jgi:hypothetical protein